MGNEPIQVLLIEDNAGDAEALKAMLNRQANDAFHLEWVDRLSKGLDRLAGGGVDVVLSSVRLPDSAGVETLHRLHAQAPLVPVVLLTSMDQDHERMLEWVQQGAQDYLEKGQVDGKLLSRVLRCAIERKRQDLRKDDFVNIVSHELRTPLTIIREGISQITEGICGDTTPEQKGVLAIALKNLDRLSRILNDLLDLSKLEAGKLRLERDLVDLREVAAELVASFNLRAKERGIALQGNLPPHPIEMYVDRDKVTQVLVNLLNNALKFTEKGSITLSIADQETQVECSVSDTGRGILAEDLPEVFRKFQQFGCASDPGTEKGTGLGLAISRGIVELHGGRIWVESQLGAGTRFAFSLPRYSARQIFHHCVHQALAQSARESKSLSVVVFRFQNLGGLEKHRGREAIVRLVRKFHTILKANLRRRADTSVVEARSVFLLLPDTAKQDAQRVAQRIRSHYESSLSPEGWEAQARVEFEVAGYPEDGLSAEALFSKVEMAVEVSSKKRVLLLIEDEPDQAQLVQGRLRAQGFQVLLAQDGEEGLRKAAEERPDLILVDVIIPRMNGYETCRRLKSDPQLREIPVVLVSAYETEDFARRCKAVGADAWLKRPYDSTDLLATVRRLL